MLKNESFFSYSKSIRILIFHTIQSFDVVLVSLIIKIWVISYFYLIKVCKIGQNNAGKFIDFVPIQPFFQNMSQLNLFQFDHPQCRNTVKSPIFAAALFCTIFASPKKEKRTLTDFRRKTDKNFGFFLLGHFSTKQRNFCLFLF